MPYEMIETELMTSDGTVIYVHSWCVDAPKAAVLLAHGMAEHSMRYAGFAEFLNANGIDFYCHDQRGHGKTAGERHGHMRKGVEWNLMMNDLFTIKKKLIDTRSDCPVFLMGHSMGSFLVRCAVQVQPNLFDGLIVSGTGDSQGLVGKAGAMLTKALCSTQGEQSPANLMQNMVFGGYNKSFASPRTQSDWLSRDEAVVDAYLADPWCGFVCSNGFFHELMQGIQMANDPKGIAKMRKNMPIYLFSGEADPVGTMGKGVKNVQNALVKAGLSDVTMKLYPEGRHEMLNELNKDEVMNEILAWIEKITA